MDILYSVAAIMKYSRDMSWFMFERKLTVWTPIMWVLSQAFNLYDLYILSFISFTGIIQCPILGYDLQIKDSQ